MNTPRETFMAGHNFSYKEVNYSVYVTQQKDGRWNWAYTLTMPPVYWKNPEAPAATPEQAIEEARLDAERRIDAM
ncbi:hypothetical protein [Paraburkholderia sp. SIMBA_030]|uniref:hypothetical protein n=1 Tax=Paraburkholderia sp. SIMBA_030 TaxID=3085773 RepID=UPI0039793753